MTTERNDRRSRETVQWGNPEMDNVDRGYSHAEDQFYIEASKTPDEQELIHTELRTLLRWEDDGGRTL